MPAVPPAPLHFGFGESPWPRRRGAGARVCTHALRTWTGGGVQTLGHRSSTGGDGQGRAAPGLRRSGYPPVMGGHPLVRGHRCLRDVPWLGSSRATWHRTAPVALCGAILYMGACPRTCPRGPSRPVATSRPRRARPGNVTAGHGQGMSPQGRPGRLSHPESPVPPLGPRALASPRQDGAESLPSSNGAGATRVCVRERGRGRCRPGGTPRWDAPRAAPAPPAPACPRAEDSALLQVTAGALGTRGGGAGHPWVPPAPCGEPSTCGPSRHRGATLGPGHDAGTQSRRSDLGVNVGGATGTHGGTRAPTGGMRAPVAAPWHPPGRRGRPGARWGHRPGCGRGRPAGP